MKLTSLLLCAALATLMAGCSAPAPAAKASGKSHVGKAADTQGEKVEKALLQGTPTQLTADRIAVKQWRRGGETKDKRWPTCAALTKNYGDIAKLESLAGVQEAMAAAQVDDYVVCDQPALFAAAKFAAESAVMRLATDLPARETVAYLISHPRGRKMDECWLSSLRDSRQNGSPYNQAFDRAQARCAPQKPAK